MDWRERSKRKTVSFEELARRIRSRDFAGVGLAIDACPDAMYDAILDCWQESANVIIGDSVPVRPSRPYDFEFMLNLDGHVNYHPSIGMPLTKDTQIPITPLLPEANSRSGRSIRALVGYVHRHGRSSRGDSYGRREANLQRRDCRGSRTQGLSPLNVPAPALPAVI
jgi:hypothetical protein